MKKKNIVFSLCLAVLLTAGTVALAEEMKCKECHEANVNSFTSSTHAKIWATREGEKPSCQACHGPTDTHIKNGGGKDSIISFTKHSLQTGAEQSKQCLGCHKKTAALSLWDSGKHKKNGVSCASCHNIHKGKEMMMPTVQTCFGCHKDIKADANKASHHPIVEGKVTCWDCHNPHGALSHGMIKAENTNQLCYKCHGDKRGPFLWEHPPVEENCLICHKPHGSQHYRLLTRRAPFLCEDCHNAAHGDAAKLDGNQGFGGTTRSTKVYGRACLNCHGHIHGSMAPHDTQNNGVYSSGKYFVR